MVCGLNTAICLHQLKSSFLCHTISPLRKLRSSNIFNKMAISYRRCVCQSFFSLFFCRIHFRVIISERFNGFIRKIYQCCMICVEGILLFFNPLSGLGWGYGPQLSIFFFNFLLSLRFKTPGTFLEKKFVHRTSRQERRPKLFILKALPLLRHNPIVCRPSRGWGGGGGCHRKIVVRQNLHWKTIFILSAPPPPPTPTHPIILLL